MLRMKAGLAVVAIVVASLGGYAVASHGVRAQSAGPDSEGLFKVEASTAELPADVVPSGPEPMVALPKTEDFEGAWPGDWALYGDPTWGPEDCNKHGGTNSGWSAAWGGGALAGCVNDYPNDQDAWMIYGPFSLVGATSAGVDFWFDLNSEAGYEDLMFVGSSTDGGSFSGWQYSGDFGGWRNDYPLDLADRLGEPQVWIGFMFSSNESVTGPGAFIDDIEIWADYGLEGCTLGGPARVVARDLPDAAGASEQPARLVSRLLPEEPGGSVAPAPEPNVVDAAATGERQLRTPPDIAPSFDGLDYDDNPSGLSPPDPQVAVGPDHVFEVVNVSGRIFDKSGGVVDTFTLRDFFSLPPELDFDCDPKVIYDALSGRWFASELATDDTSTGAVYFAVSQSSDPTGAWNVYHCDYDHLLPDYPGIGLSNDKFTVSSNLFSLPASNWVAEHTFVVEKADIMAGVAAASVGLHNFPYEPDRFTVRPAHSLSSVDDQYLATFDSTAWVFPVTDVTVIRVSGTPNAGNVTESTWNLVLTNTQDSPPASQTAGDGSIDSGDFRLLEAVYRDGRLWTSASAACTPPGDTATRSCGHFLEISTETQALINDIMFGAAGEYFSWPAIRTDSDYNLHVSLTHTTPDIFAEARVAGRLASDAPNTMSGSSLLRAGEVVHSSGRWGDYMGAGVDPADPCYVWVVGQYAKDTSPTGWDWGTYIGRLHYPECGALECVFPHDADCDACWNSVEPGLSPAADPADPWDWYDVPVPTLFSGGHISGDPSGTDDRDHAVTIIDDVLAVLEYAGCEDGGLPNAAGRQYNQDVNGDTVDDGRAYDRSAGGTRSAGPDGAITIIEDMLLLLAQAGYGCGATPP